MKLEFKKQGFIIYIYLDDVPLGVISINSKGIENIDLDNVISWPCFATIYNFILNDGYESLADGVSVYRKVS